jgi:hypothetical protein
VLNWLQELLADPETLRFLQDCSAHTKANSIELNCVSACVEQRTTRTTSKVIEAVDCGAALMRTASEMSANESRSTLHQQKTTQVLSASATIQFSSISYR